MQLVAYGAQDIYLTGNPQITFFKVVYRRHTNFAMESVEQTLNGSVGLGNKQTATISRNGDLVGRMYLEFTSTVAANSCNAGHNSIDNVEVQIGGQMIDKHYGHWMEVWAELTEPNPSGSVNISGGSFGTRFQNMTCAGGSAADQSVDPAVECRVPLQFWFNRNPGLALPLIALQYHEVKVLITWASSNFTPSAEKLWADYIYLDTDERRRFAQVSHEYLIEQLQYQSEGAAAASYKLNFNHPVKELVWTDNVTTQKTKLQLNGHDRFAEQDREYFQIYQPMQHHTAVPGFNIKETERPQLLSPPLLVVATSATGDAIANATDGSQSKVTIAATLTNTPKVGDLLSVGASSGDVEEVSSRTVQVVAVGTESADFTVTPRITAVTDDANNSFSISIVARVQDPQSRCSQLATNVNVYSFALKPEEHQPSGTCNFSRIDNAKLVLSGSSATVSSIYAVNYNVLRVMSGMGGLAYSN